MLLGFIYPGVRVPGKPYVSVNPGKANQTTTFSWNATSYARYYDVYVYKAGESNPTQFQYGVNGTSWSCTLPAGNYRVAVASVNHAQYAYTFSDSVNFTVQAAPVTHTHSYQRVTVKASFITIVRYHIPYDICRFLIESIGIVLAIPVSVFIASAIMKIPSRKRGVRE